jgi:hypothetical protein
MWERGKMYMVFWLKNLEESDHLGDTGREGRINIKMDLRENENMQTEFTWLRVGTDGPWSTW